jgi:hypothetical protein
VRYKGDRIQHWEQSCDSGFSGNDLAEIAKQSRHRRQEAGFRNCNANLYYMTKYTLMESQPSLRLVDDELRYEVFKTCTLLDLMRDYSGCG